MFMDSKRKTQFAKEEAQMRYLFKKLLDVLYKGHNFYDKLLAKRPNASDEILSGLIIADQLPKKNKIMRAEDLSVLEFDDPILNDAVYHMLAGTMEKIPEPKNPVMPPENEEENEEDEGSDAQCRQLPEFKSRAGYYSIKDFITIQTLARVRVFLAPRKILLAIFTDPVLVEEVIAMRRSLHKQVRKTKDAQSATNAFKEVFLNRTDPNLDETLLDFTVTSTNPDNYL
jgi:hypothetical protein